ncbi:MAG: hypothetical protein SCK57_14615 [Bacillota bacterium]|nr:hypothetical protein [Bacillota bacterium]MDW7678881.1 hypothetical protein [Bacillota bacterium]
MSLRDKGNELREFEGKDSRNAQYTTMQKRVLLEAVYTMKHCLLMILAGLFFALALTGFEFALRNPEVEGLLITLFRGGFFISIAGVLMIPYGIYHLIKGFKIR